MYNKRGIVIAAFAFFNAAAISFSEPSLQSMIDAAALSPEKKLVLDRELYFVPEGIRLSQKHSGLTIEGAKGKLPEIIGGRQISNWEVDGKFWKAHLPELDFLHSLWVDGRRAQLAKTPNEGAFYVLAGAQSYADENGKFSKNTPARAFVASGKDVQSLTKLSAQELSEAYIDTFHAWFHHRYPVDAVVDSKKDKTSTVFLRRLDTDHFLKVDNNARFRILNIRAALDEAGEFFFDKKTKTLWYIPRAGENIAEARAYYPTVERVLVGEGASAEKKLENIVLRNIKFSVGGCFPDTDGTWTSRHRYHNFAHFDGLVSFSNAKNVNIEKCTVSNCEGYGIAFKSCTWDCSVSNCELFDLGCGGIRAGHHEKKSQNFPADESDPIASGRFQIKNNIIYAYGKWRASGIGIITYDSRECTVEDNAIFDGGYSGIVAGWTLGFKKTHVRKNKIRNNRIFRIGNGLLSDMGGIYTLGYSPESEISGNEIYDVFSHKYGGWGIYNDEGSEGYTVEKNFVHDTLEDSYFMHYGKNVLVRNNLFVNAEVSQVGLGRLGEEYPDEYRFEQNVVLYKSPVILLRNRIAISPINARFDKNIYYNFGGEVLFGNMTFAQWRATGQDKNSFVENPNLEQLRPEYLKSDNPTLAKIGFEPFSTKDAGVKDEMKKRFDAIMKSHEFSKIDKSPLSGADEFGASLSFEDSNILSPSAMLVPSNADAKVMREPEGVVKTFLRITDTPNGATWQPLVSFNPHLNSGIIKLSFKVRLNEKGNLTVDMRAAGETAGASLNFSGARIRSNSGSDNIPINEWIYVSMSLPLGAGGKTYSYKVFSADGKVLADRTAHYTCKKINSVGWVGFMLTGNSADCVVDISDVEIYR